MRQLAQALLERQPDRLGVPAARESGGCPLPPIQFHPEALEAERPWTIELRLVTLGTEPVARLASPTAGADR